MTLSPLIANSRAQLEPMIPDPTRATFFGRGGFFKTRLFLSVRPYLEVIGARWWTEGSRPRHVYLRVSRLNPRSSPMKIAILGTGNVGSHLSSVLVKLGHEVMMGFRTADNARAVEWTRMTGPRASHGTFADAAAFGEVVFNCTAGSASLEALKMAGAQNLKGKVL